MTAVLPWPSIRWKQTWMLEFLGKKVSFFTNTEYSITESSTGGALIPALDINKY